MKRIIRLTESDLHNVIKHSVKRIIREMPEMNPMANGGRNPYDTKGYCDIMDDFMNQIAIEISNCSSGMTPQVKQAIDDVCELFSEFVEGKENAFLLVGYMDSSIDEFNRLQSIDGEDKIIALINQFNPGANGQIVDFFKNLAENALQTVVNNLSEDDFEEQPQYEREYDPTDY